MPYHSEGSCASGGWIQLFNSLIFVYQDVLSMASSLGVSLRFLRKMKAKGGFWKEWMEVKAYV